MADEMRRGGHVEVAAAGIPSVAALRDDGPMAGGRDVHFDEAATDSGFSGNPVRFAAHTVLYYAGRLADRIVSLYDRAFRLDKEYVADFSKSTGIALADRGDWEKAIPLLEKALAVAPDDNEARVRLADAYGAANEYEKACLHLKKALEASPKSARIARALGVLYARRQDYDQAIEHLERAVELDPGHAKSFRHLGAAYDSKKEYGRAVESFKTAIRLDPRSAKAYQALGFTYESMGNRGLAVECFKKALGLE